MGQLNVLVMFKRVKPTLKEKKEMAVRVNGLNSIGVLQNSLERIKESGLTIDSVIVMLYLYGNYSASVKGMGEVLGLSYLGCFNIVHRLIGLGYIERVNAYSVILTNKGVLYVESFI